MYCVGVVSTGAAWALACSGSRDETSAPPREPPSIIPEQPASSADHWRQPAAQLAALAPRRVASAEAMLHSEGGEIRSRQLSSRRALVDVTLPSTAGGAVRLGPAGERLRVAFHLVGANESEPILESDTAAFVGALPNAGHVVLRVSPYGVEDFVELSAPPEANQLTYEVWLKDVAGLRLVGGSLEYLDEAGTPRLRTARPWLRDAQGAHRWAELSVHGCSYDTDPAPPWGRAPVAPGADRCEIAVTWSDAGLTYPLLIDPPWTVPDDLAQPRAFHTATLLQNGRVLIVGGWRDNVFTPIATTEIYDPATRTFSTTADLTPARAFHSATLLETDGSVLVVGGYEAHPADATNRVAPGVASISVRRFSDGAWLGEPDLPEPRAEHAATRLPSNERVVVTGGGGLQALTFTPDLLGSSWSVGAPALVPRFRHTASLTAGRVLVVGGAQEPFPGGEGLQSVESLEAITDGAWRNEKPALFQPFAHTASVLSTEDVLVVDQAGAHLFDAFLRQWRPSLAQPTSKRQYHAAALLPNVSSGDTVVVLGGRTGPVSHRTAEYYSANEETWTASPLVLEDARVGHVATVLEDGVTILVTGGRSDQGLTTLARSELAQFRGRGAPCASDTECVSGACGGGVCCDRRCSGACEACSRAATGLEDGLCAPLPAATLCAASTGSCDRAALCDGRARECPEPPLVPDGEPCDDGNDATQNDTCTDGVCAGESCLGAECCDPPCDGACATCVAPAEGAPRGTCEPLPAGTLCAVSGEACIEDATCDGRATDCPASASGCAEGLDPARRYPTPFSCSTGRPSPGRARGGLGECALLGSLALWAARRRQRRMSRRASVASLALALLAGCDDDAWLNGNGGTGGSSGGSAGTMGSGGNDAGPDAGACVKRLRARWQPGAALPAPARLLHASTTTPSGPLLFGGVEFLRGSLGDTWQLEPGGWAPRSSDTAPAPRGGHAMSAATGEGRVLLFGGEGTELFADTWLWETAAWRALCTPSEPCAAPQPSARVGHAMVFDGNRQRVVLVGGFDGQQVLEDTWTWSESAGWVELCSGSCEVDPASCCGYTARFGHGLAYDSNRGQVLMFGGNDGAADLSSLWTLAANEWKEIVPPGASPGARASHSMAFDERSRITVVMGGTRNGQTLDDGLWGYHPETGEWLVATAIEQPPTARAFAPLVAEATSEQLVLLGGGVTGEQTDTWRLQLDWVCDDVTGDAGVLDAGGGSDGGGVDGGGGESHGTPPGPCQRLLDCCPLLTDEQLGRCYAVAESTDRALCEAESTSCP